MFSLSDLVKGCVPLECREATLCNKPGSDQIFSTSGIPATVSIPQESVSLVSSRGEDISDKVSLSTAADDGGKRKRYFCKNTDGNTAQFNLSDEDWDRIVITTYPRGGRLLAGDWAEIFRNKLKESNPWCRFGFKNNHVISSNSPKKHSAPFFRGSGKCKLPDCNVTVRIAIRKEKGKCADVTYLGNICHKHHAKGCDISK